MEAFYRNLHIVLEFASRVDLYGDREAILTGLQELRLNEAQAACARAMATCHRDFQLRGFDQKEILQAPLYRRLLQLDEMIHDLADSLGRKTAGRTGNQSTGLTLSDEKKLFPPPARRA